MGIMRAIVHKLTPWHDEEQAQEKDERVNRLEARSERAERTTYKLIESYRKADQVIANTYRER